MRAIQVVAIILIVLGILGLLFGGFSFTKSTEKAELGPLEFSVKDKEQVNIPAWLSIAAIIGGGVLLVAGARRPGRR